MNSYGQKSVGMFLNLIKQNRQYSKKGIQINKPHEARWPALSKGIGCYKVYADVNRKIKQS